MKKKKSVLDPKSSEVAPPVSQDEKIWKHPGEKLWELGADHLSDDEILAVLIGSGTQGRSAMDIAKDVFDRYYSIAGLFGKPADNLLEIKGLKKRKLIRLLAAFELAGRVIEHHNNWGDYKPFVRKKESPEGQKNLFS